MSVIQKDRFFYPHQATMIDSYNLFLCVIQSVVVGDKQKINSVFWTQFYSQIPVINTCIQFIKLKQLFIKQKKLSRSNKTPTKNVTKILMARQEWNELPHDKTNETTVHPAKTQVSLGMVPVWPVFTVCSMGSLGLKLSSCRQRRLWSDWVDAEADLSLRWAHSHFAGFVTRRLKCDSLLLKHLIRKVSTSLRVLVQNVPLKNLLKSSI